MINHPRARALAWCAPGALALVVGTSGVALAAPKMPGMSMSDMQQMKTAGAAALAAKPRPGSTIVISNFSFSPGSIKVRPGQKIGVTNKDSVTHTVTSTTGKFNTGNVAPGKTVTFAAPKKAGKYPYRCNIHQYMTGMLVVS